MTNFRLGPLMIIFYILGCLQSGTCNARPLAGASRILSQLRHQPNTRNTSSAEDDKNDNPQPIIQVREVLPTKLQNDIDPELNKIQDPRSSSQSRNRSIWFCGNVDQIPKLKDSSSSRKSKRQRKDEHPLRTDLWKLQIQWFRKAKGQSVQSESDLQIEFDRDGLCRLVSMRDNEHAPKVWGAGTWFSRPYVVSFTVPCKEVSGTGDGHFNSKYIFTAQLHHNPFGKQPKLLQGAILLEQERTKLSPHVILEFDEERDRSFLPQPPTRWFRPVVGKFTGEGIGVDTLDYSYSKRQ